MLPLIRGTGMLTLGANQKNIDFESEWRKRMQACQIPGRKPHKPKGQLCMLEASKFRKNCFGYGMQVIVLPHGSNVTNCKHGLDSCHFSPPPAPPQTPSTPFLPLPLQPLPLQPTTAPGTPMVLCSSSSCVVLPLSHERRFLVVILSLSWLTFGHDNM